MEQIKNMEREKTFEGVERKVAQALLRINAVGFRPENPIKFKSGIISPVYVDNRLLTSNPNEWKEIIGGFQELIREKSLSYDMIAGIESAGISHSAVLGYTEGKPMVYVKKEAKEHGKKIRIEGANPKDQDSWVQIENYISQKTDTRFSHSICPKCVKELYPDFNG